VGGDLVEVASQQLDRLVDFSAPFVAWLSCSLLYRCLELVQLN
jgi:hypothetical protein